MKKESTKRDQYNGVLEGLRSDFRVFGEALSVVGEKVTRIDVRVGKLEKDMGIVKGELALIRHHQVTRDEFKLPVSSCEFIKLC